MFIILWLFFTGVWVIAGLLKSPGLFSFFWPISTILLFGWSPLVLLFLNPPVPEVILCWAYQEHQLQLVSLSLSCSIVFFYSLQVPGIYLSFRLPSFCPVVNRNGKVHYSAGYRFLLTISLSGRLDEIRWSVCVSKSLRSLCVSFSWRNGGLCIYYLFVWSNLNFLINSPLITLPNQSCLVFYSFSVHLLHSLIM